MLLVPWREGLPSLGQVGGRAGRLDKYSTMALAYEPRCLCSTFETPTTGNSLRTCMGTHLDHPAAQHARSPR